MKLAPRLPSRCWAPQSGIRMLQLLAIYGARASDALHPALRSHVPALTHHHWAGPRLLYALSMGPKWGLPPTITRAGLLLCSLPPGAQPTVSMSHPWDHAAVDLWLPLDPKSQLRATTAGLPWCFSTAGARVGADCIPGGCCCHQRTLVPSEYCTRSPQGPYATLLLRPPTPGPTQGREPETQFQMLVSPPQQAPRPSSAVVLCAPDSSPWLRCSSEHQCTRPDPRDSLS